MSKYSPEEITEIKKSPWNFFTKHRKVTALIIIMIVIWGVTSLINIPKEIQPEIKLPFGSIFTVYPGANPLDVEELVTKEIETSISNVSDIKNINSTSQFGFSSVIAEFESGTDLDQAIDDLRNAVEKVKSQLPEDANDPTVSSFEVNSFPVVVFSLLSNLPEEQLKTVAEDVQDEIKALNGVSDIIIIGARDKQIEVNLNQKALEQYELSLNDVSMAIQNANLNFPIGEISNDGVRYSIRVETEIESAYELSQIPIKQFFNQSGSSNFIVLSDIAEVRETLEEKSTIARFGDTKTGEIKNSISLQIYKKPNANIVDVAERAKMHLEEIRGTVIPFSVDIDITNDNSEFLREDFEILGKNGIATVILIMALLFIFLGFKEGIISGISIPFSMLITVGVLYLMGETINSLTLFALVFSLGLLIDNAVIIIEGIYENLRSGQYTSYGSAIIGIKEFKWPIIAGTLTTVFAFLPMLTISGITGQFMRIIPITVTTILLASLFVNLTITPTLSAKFLKPGKKRNLFKGVQRWYKNFITGVINSGFKKFISIFLMTIVMLISFSLPILGIVKSEAFPVSDFKYFYVDIETPPGTVLEETDKVVKQVEEILMEIPDIKNITTSIGTNAGAAFRSVISISSNNTNIASVTVNLVEKEKRDNKSYELSELIREKLQNVQGGEVSIFDLQGGPPTGAPIAARITGPDLKKLEEISNTIAGYLEKIEGTLDVETSIVKGAGEFNITLNRNKLNYYGIAPIQIAGLLRSSIGGVESTELRKDGEETDVIIQYKFSDDDLTIDEISNIFVNSPTSGLIPLSELINVEFKDNLTSISHLNEERVMTVSSYIKDRTTLEIIDDLNKKLEKTPIPKGYTLDFGGEFEEVQQSFKDLGLALLVGLILIAMLLVLQFKSFRQPFIIMLSLPFALTGVFIGLAIMNITISIPSVIGIVGLAGVVVNDAIVLIDQMNNNRRRGMEFKQSIIEGATSRLQPVFLTTATSILGILPLALTDEIWGSLGFAFIFGLTTQYFLVLLLDPILYSMFSKKDQGWEEPEVLHKIPQEV
ncbi:efflux RND transporter permease subunit [Patescibacteria group bacterium]